MTSAILEFDLPPEHPLRQILDTLATHPDVKEPLLDFLLSAVNERVDENAKAVRELQRAVRLLRHNRYEHLCREEIGVILDGWIDRPILAYRDRISSLLLNARWREIISRDEYQLGLRHSIIAHETIGKSKPTHYGVVEVTSACNRAILEMAVKRAEIIGRAIGARADAFAVTNHSWPPEVNETARQLGVTIIRHESPEYADC